MREIIQNSKLYSPSIANQPQKVTQTASYKAVMEPYIRRLEKHRDKIMKAMEAKDLDLEDYRILSEAYDRMNKNMLLAQGKATENVATIVNIVRYDDLPQQRNSTIVQTEDAVLVDKDTPSMSDNDVIDNID